MEVANARTRLDELRDIYISSSLSELFQIKTEDDYPDRKYSALRFHTNPFRIRAIEIWETSSRYFRIYHGKVVEEVKAEINSITGCRNSTTWYSDFDGVFLDVAKKLYDILSNDRIVQIVRDNPLLTRNSAYEGLELPDVDTSESNILGRVFNWKEIIAICEDASEDNALKKALSQSGVYLQRSIDGKTRYVGSASGGEGFLGRWMRHLTSNGSAKHLNLFVLENGYNSIAFTVLEITPTDLALTAERGGPGNLDS